MDLAVYWADTLLDNIKFALNYSYYTVYQNISGVVVLSLCLHRGSPIPRCAPVRVHKLKTSDLKYLRNYLE
jgi:hypothetical protein